LKDRDDLAWEGGRTTLELPTNGALNERHTASVRRAGKGRDGIRTSGVECQQENGKWYTQPLSYRIHINHI
jgi:hypothetical protein